MSKSDFVVVVLTVVLVVDFIVFAVVFVVDLAVVCAVVDEDSSVAISTVCTVVVELLSSCVTV